MGIYSRYIFPRILDWSLSAADVREQRDIALREARGRVLEIGFGTGLNLRHYPPAVTSLVAADPEQMLRERVQDRIRRASIPVQLIHLDASGRLPFPDNEFDSVVTTFTLCSITNIESALGEIRRVLKPEGRYVFLEHGRSADPAIARRQDFFNPFQKIVACGCNLNRSIDRLIAESGFEVTNLDRFRMPGVPRIAGEMYRGAAKKVDSSE
ncbi:MAG TPA: class I SAM-dependent methyltransferase [Blastocatellia bacterium]|nr:class I SAM-dependent methyltransferase [Blastocatellia bacterium]